MSLIGGLSAPLGLLTFGALLSLIGPSIDVLLSGLAIGVVGTSMLLLMRRPAVRGRPNSGWEVP